ncbi:hypothetical protein BJV82DRAFT_622825 [Fennellomyces sp. T-0311]|nr:hypothetical protein BJV82DRAFT_622825 [Fennellomyces sp. T-0311]
MIQSLDVPVVSLAVPNIHKLNEITSDDLSCMWTVFTKCKDNLENGRRLENLSWRLWYRESLIEKAQEQHVRTPIPIQSNNNDTDYFSYASSESSCESSLQTPPSLKHMSPSSFKRMISSLNNPIEKQQQQPIQLLPTPTPTPPASVAPQPKAQPVVPPQPKKKAAYSAPKPPRKFFVSDDEESEDEEHDRPTTIDEEGFWSTVRSDDEDFAAAANTTPTTTAIAPTISETDFKKKSPTLIAKQPRPSLLSAMLHQKQRPTRPRRRPHHEPELSQSLKYCVDWEQRQNALSTGLDSMRQYYPLETNDNYWESFRGW